MINHNINIIAQWLWHLQFRNFEAKEAVSKTEGVLQLNVNSKQHTNLWQK